MSCAFASWPTENNIKNNNPQEIMILVFIVSRGLDQDSNILYGSTVDNIYRIILI